MEQIRKERAERVEKEHKLREERRKKEREKERQLREQRRLEQEKREQERRERARKEVERVRKEREKQRELEKARERERERERERFIKERKEREERERKEREREREQLERERLERERLERERRERERLERERQERERQERERLERERLAREEREQRIERERQRLEQERLDRERQERDRLERERRIIDRGIDRGLGENLLKRPATDDGGYYRDSKRAPLNQSGDRQDFFMSKQGRGPDNYVQDDVYDMAYQRRSGSGRGDSRNSRDIRAEAPQNDYRRDSRPSDGPPASDIRRVIHRDEFESRSYRERSPHRAPDGAPRYRDDPGQRSYPVRERDYERRDRQNVLEPPNSGAPKTLSDVLGRAGLTGILGGQAEARNSPSDDRFYDQRSFNQGESRNRNPERYPREDYNGRNENMYGPEIRRDEARGRVDIHDRGNDRRNFEDRRDGFDQRQDQPNRRDDRINDRRDYGNRPDIRPDERRSFDDRRDLNDRREIGNRRDANERRDIPERRDAPSRREANDRRDPNERRDNMENFNNVDRRSNRYESDKHDYKSANERRNVREEPNRRDSRDDNAKRNNAGDRFNDRSQQNNRRRRDFDPKQEPSLAERVTKNSALSMTERRGLHPVAADLASRPLPAVVQPPRIVPLSDILVRPLQPVTATSHAAQALQAGYAVAAHGLALQQAAATNIQLNRAGRLEYTARVGQPQAIIPQLPQRF